MTALLLDEMLSPGIAMQMSAAGHDVVAVSGRPDLRGMPDSEVLELATRENRVLVTDNVKDFAPLNASWAAQGRTHAGLVFISSKSFPQDRRRVGLIAAALTMRLGEGRWPSPGQYEFL